MKTYGIKIVWGVPEKTKPLEIGFATMIRPWPKVKIRLRANQPGVIILRHWRGNTSEHYLLDNENEWAVGPEIGRNMHHEHPQ